MQTDIGVGSKRPGRLPPAVVDVGTITLVYVLAHGLMLLNRGAFWDDWVIYPRELGTLVELFTDAGTPWTGYIHWLIGLGGPFGYRLVTFASHLAAALALWATLEKAGILDREKRLLLVLLFATLPLNAARVAMISAVSSLCWALFFTGLLLTELYLRRGQVGYRIAALACLVASFTTPSLLVLHYFVVGWVALRTSPRRVLRFSDYLLAPVIFFVAKGILWPPVAQYAGYNQVSLGSALAALPLSLYAFHTSLVQPLAEIFGVGSVIGGLQGLARVVPSVLIAGLCAGLVVRRLRSASSHEDVWLLLLGGLAFWAAAFPYLAVGKLPLQGDWHSRHQLALPLGAALGLLGGLYLLTGRRRLRRVLGGALVVAFAGSWAGTYLSFQMDWYKQSSVIENLSSLPEVREARSVLLEDHTRDLNHRGRRYRFYEYTGIMRAAFGDQTRFASDREEFEVEYGGDIEAYRGLFTRHYNLAEAEPTQPDHDVSILRGPSDASRTASIRALWLERARPQEFRDWVRGLVRVDAAPVGRGSGAF